MAELRPLTFGEILDGALKIYRRHFGLFLQLSVVLLAVPVALLGYGVLPLLNQPIYFVMDPVGSATRILGLGLLYYLAGLLLTAGTVRVISDSYLGHQPTLRGALGTGISRLWALLGVGLGKALILGVLGGGGFAIMGVTGFMLENAGFQGLSVAVGVVLGLTVAWLVIWVACGYGVTTQVVVLEQLHGALDAFRKSWGLTRGFKRKVFGLAVVAFLLFNVIPGAVFQFAGGVAAMTNPSLGIGIVVAQLIVQLLLAPAIACVFTLMYYDLRVRREGFDLEILSQQLGLT
jgi:hypothetical protein